MCTMQTKLHANLAIDFCFSNKLAFRDFWYSEISNLHHPTPPFLLNLKISLWAQQQGALQEVRPVLCIVYVG
jgi:hypothetical protein